MTKRLVDIDDEVLHSAQAALGTDTIKDTVNAALAEVSETQQKKLARAFEIAAEVELEDRSAAWR